jgi:AraC family transcriptional regulator
MQLENEAHQLERLAQACQIISKEASYGGLAEALLREALRCTRATRGGILLGEGGKLPAEPDVSFPCEKAKFFTSYPPAAGFRLPADLSDRVLRRQDTVVRQTTRESSAFVDPVDQPFGNISQLCLPLVHQEGTIGVLYLESEREEDIFTPRCVWMTSMLASQAAVSLESVRLFEVLRKTNMWMVKEQEIGRMDSHGWNLPKTTERVHAGSGSSIGASVRPTVKITPAGIAKRLSTGWRFWSSESVYVPMGRKIEFHFEGPSHLLILYNEGSRRSGETSIAGLQPSGLRRFMHKLTFVPAGSAYHERQETGASTRITFLYWDPSVSRGPDESKNACLPRMYFEDPLVWETASKLKNAIESGQARSMPYLEALSNVLAHELCRLDEKVRHESVASRGGLASWQKRLVVDYIEEHVGEQIGLPRLAELARLSLHHFCRAFKQSFGIPAHQYQVKRRMELAKLLLVDRTISVTDIALRLGYAQTSSFSVAFRKTTGWTPTVYRREFNKPISESFDQ